MEEPSDSDGLELPPAGLLMSQESHVAHDDPLPPPPPPPGPKSKAMPGPKSKAMPKVLLNEPGPSKPRLAPKPKSSGSSDAAASSDDWFSSLFGHVESKSDEVKSDQVGKGQGKSDEIKSDQVGKGQGKSDEIKSDQVGKGQGKSDEIKSEGKSDEVKSDEVGKGQGKSDKGKSDEVGKGQGKSELCHRQSGYWSTLPMARGPQMGGIPCPVMHLGVKLSNEHQ